MNFLEGSCVCRSGTVFQMADMTIPLERYAFADGAAGRRRAEFGIRPEHVSIGEAALAQPYHQDVEVEIVEPMGADTLVWGKLAGQNFSFRVETEHAVAEGDRVLVGFDPGRASIFDAETGDRI